MALTSDQQVDLGCELGIELLTDAEKHVCQLATTGLTNRQIADERCVSVKAVEFHLHNAYVKLNVANRTQLAFRLFEQSRPKVSLTSAPEVPAPHPAPPTTTPTTTPSAIEAVADMEPATDIEAAAEQMLREVLEAVSSEIGGRALSDSELARLYDCVASEVAHAVSRQFSLDDSQLTTLDESLRHQLRLAYEADTIAS